MFSKITLLLLCLATPVFVAAESSFLRAGDSQHGSLRATDGTMAIHAGDNGGKTIKLEVEDSTFFDRLLQLENSMPVDPVPSAHAATNPPSHSPVTSRPTDHPVMDPTPAPTMALTAQPTDTPVMDPSPPPTTAPVAGPTHHPPVMDPAPLPTTAPVVDPTPLSLTPSVMDHTPISTTAPVMDPTEAPVVPPTMPPPTTRAPTAMAPTPIPTTVPIIDPTKAPVVPPTMLPAATRPPTVMHPTPIPTTVPVLTDAPVIPPTMEPPATRPPLSSKCSVGLVIECVSLTAGQTCSDSTPIGDACIIEAQFTYTFTNTDSIQQEILGLQINQLGESIIVSDIPGALPDTMLEPGATMSVQPAPISINICEGQSFATSAALSTSPPVSVEIASITCASVDGVDCMAIQPPSEPGVDCLVDIEYTYTITNTGLGDLEFYELKRIRNEEPMDLIPFLEDDRLAVGASTQALEPDTIDTCVANVFTTKTEVVAGPTPDMICTQRAAFP